MRKLNARHDTGCAWAIAQNTCDCSRGEVLDDLDVVAKQVIWRCVEYALNHSIDWGDFPDLGGYTWEDVQTVVYRRAERPDPVEYDGAYKRLAELAVRETW
jgi:hypothetical protein